MGEVSDIRCEPGPDIVCIQGGGATSLNVNGKGWGMNVSFTLNATDVHGIAYEMHSSGEPSERQQSKDS